MPATDRETRSGAGRSKRRVYFNEFNVCMPKVAYLPLVSGLLRAYAETVAGVRDNYAFMPFLFLREEPEAILNAYEEPTVAAFSTSMWNHHFNLRLAELVKKKFPACVVIFGGPHVPHNPDKYFAKNSFIDVAVRGEGEIAFSMILNRLIESRDLSGIPAVSWRDPATGRCIRNPEEAERESNIDIFPSPYLLGYYEYLFEQYPDLSFQAIIETDRGCPFLCSYCYWGQGGLSRKFRLHSLEYVRREVEWIAQHKIAYLFNAASNFGVHAQDMEIAKVLVQAKQRYGYPEKFRSCYAKNAEERIFAIGSLLHKHQMEKGITLSHQSMNPITLKNVHRRNITMEMYANLQTRFNRASVPVYTELILGMPGETYDSWKAGIETLLEFGLKNQLFIYLCQVYPNTELAESEYQRRFGIVTRQIALTETHGTGRAADSIPEYEEIIVGTRSMPVDDWKRAVALSWMTMMLTSMKLGFFVLAYLKERFGIPFTDFITYLVELRMPPGTGSIIRSEVATYYKRIDSMLSGAGHASVVSGFGDRYWDEEEASFLRIAEKTEEFYDELKDIVEAFLRERGGTFSPVEVEEVVIYQRMRIPSLKSESIPSFEFRFNLPGYFDALWRGESLALTEGSQTMEVRGRCFDGDKIRFAREILLWGRKSDTILNAVKTEENEHDEVHNKA